MSFSFVRPSTSASAAQWKNSDEGAVFIAGGSCVVDLLSQNVLHPSLLIDLTGLAQRHIEEKPDGSLHVGVLTTMGELAWHAAVVNRFPVLMQALLSGATPQVHHAATVGGNLLQKTRCSYYRNQGFRCNKRQPGSGCDAREGYNAGHALFGASEQCVAVHPSDLAVSLLALNATVTVEGLHGIRRVSMADLLVLPGSTPEIDSSLSSDELITAVDVPALPSRARSAYSKVDDHNSYSFAVVSVAAVLAWENNKVCYARLAAGGVAHQPWRLANVEAVLLGQTLSPAVVDKAANVAIEGAKPFTHNGYKIPLLRETVAGILTELAGEKS